MLCQLLLYNKVNQLYVYIYSHIPSLLRLPPILHILPLQVVTKHRADLPVLCSCFPLAIYFTFGSMYMSMLLSHFANTYIWNLKKKEKNGSDEPKGRIGIKTQTQRMDLRTRHGGGVKCKLGRSEPSNFFKKLRVCGGEEYKC